MSTGAGVKEGGGLCYWGQSRGEQSECVCLGEKSREGFLLLPQAGPKGLRWGQFLPSKGDKRQGPLQAQFSISGAASSAVGGDPPSGGSCLLSPQGAACSCPHSRLPSLTWAIAAFFSMP